jgi:hypothetical protein
MHILRVILFNKNINNDRIMLILLIITELIPMEEGGREFLMRGRVEVVVEVEVVVMMAMKVEATTDEVEVAEEPHHIIIRHQGMRCSMPPVQHSFKGIKEFLDCDECAWWLSSFRLDDLYCLS